MSVTEPRDSVEFPLSAKLRRDFEYLDFCERRGLAEKRDQWDGWQLLLESWRRSWRKVFFRLTPQERAAYAAYRLTATRDVRGGRMP